MSFSEKVITVRRKLNLSQERLAAQLGVSFSTINRWEKERSKPSYLAQERFISFCKDNGITFSAGE